MKMYLLLGIELIVIIIFLLHDDNWKGCILYVVAIMFAYAFYYITKHFKKPSYESRVEVATPYGIAFRYSHSRHLCPSGETTYCVEKSDKKEPSRMDTCINCGRRFWRHSYDATPEEIEWAAKSWEDYSKAIKETPAY